MSSKPDIGVPPTGEPPGSGEATMNDTLGALARDLRFANEALVLRSVLDQESAETAEEGRAQLNALVEALSEGIVIVEPSGKLLMVNRAACAILGVPEWSLVSTAETDRLELRDEAGNVVPPSGRPLARALRGDRFTDAAVAIVRPDGHKRDLVTSGTCIMDRGRVALAIVVFRDVTEVKRLESQRDEYLALISHDVRGPLASIVMLADLLERSATRQGLPREVAERATRIAENAGKISAMVEDLLETTKSASQDVSSRSLFGLAELIHGARDLLEDAARDRVRFVDAFGGACTLLADRGRIDRALGNLLSNALKYSKGPVEVRLAKDGKFAVVSVVDRGVGIPNEDVAHVFDRYFRAESGRHVGAGFGLGLYITRLIAEAHGGRTEVDSTLGEGSTFRLFLPFVPRPLAEEVV